MTGYILLLTGSVVIIGWGIFHLVTTKRLVGFFRPLTKEKKLILTMEWVVEGFTLCFLGILVLLITLLRETPTIESTVVYRAAAAMLLIMAVWTVVTGARTSIMLMKLCPAVKIIVAILFFLVSML